MVSLLEVRVTNGTRRHENVTLNGKKQPGMG